MPKPSQLQWTPSQQHDTVAGDSPDWVSGRFVPLFLTLVLPCPSKVVSPAKVASFSSHTHLQLEAFAIEQKANSSRKKSALELGPGTWSILVAHATKIYKVSVGPQLLNVLPFHWGRWRTFIRRNLWTKTMKSWVFLVCLLGFRTDFPSASDKSRICRVVSQRWGTISIHFTLKPDTIHGFYMDSLIKAPPFRSLCLDGLFGGMSHFHPFPTYSDGDHGYVWRLHVDEAGCWCWFCVAGSEWG